MLAALLLIAVPQQAEAHSPAYQATAARLEAGLKRLRFHARVKRDGQVLCRITRTSGDAAIDDAACSAARKCGEAGPSTVADMNACVREEIVRDAAREVKREGGEP